MKILSDFLMQILFETIIVNFFGYYALFIIFKISFNKQGLEWLKEFSDDESKEFSKGCLINLVDIISFFLTFVVIAYLYSFFKYYI